MRHGAELIAHVVKHSTTTRARNVIRYISPMFGFAAGRGLIPGNPWRGLYLPPGPPPRDRVLSSEEWLCLWDWGLGAPYPWGPLLRALMLSAQRLGEVSGMCWDEINGNLWVIPAARHKSKRRHEVPLSAALVALIESQPRHAPYVFSVRSGRPAAPGPTIKNRIIRETGVTDWRVHDLRRSGATRMADGGAQRLMASRLWVGGGGAGCAVRGHRRELGPTAYVREGKGNEAIEASRSGQRRVQDGRTVGGRDHDNVGVRFEAVHLYQYLVQRLLSLVVPAT